MAASCHMAFMDAKCVIFGGQDRRIIYDKSCIMTCVFLRVYNWE